MQLANCTSCTIATDQELPTMTLEVGNNANTFCELTNNGQRNKPDGIHVFFICRSYCQQTTTTPCAALKQQQQETIISKQPLN